MRTLEIAGIVASISAWVVGMYTWQGSPTGRKVAIVATASAFLILAVAAHMRGRRRNAVPSSDPEPSYDVQRGKLELTNRRDDHYEVYYPRRFVRPPSLTLRVTEGFADLITLEQRADGFRFRKGSSSYSGGGLWVEWEAQGVVQ
jgi:hypothetical protein